MDIHTKKGRKKSAGKKGKNIITTTADGSTTQTAVPSGNVSQIMNERPSSVVEGKRRSDIEIVKEGKKMAFQVRSGTPQKKDFSVR